MMIIVEPYEMRLLAREMKCDLFKQVELALVELHMEHRVNAHNNVMVPKYWCQTVLTGLTDMLDEFPNLKFGSIIEEKNRLRMYTVPTHRPVEKLKVELYNKIDDLVLNTIDSFVKSDMRPFFLK